MKCLRSWLFALLVSLVTPLWGAGSFTLLGMNDIYDITGVSGGKAGGLARVRTLRAQLEREHPELLVLLAGDFLYPSVLSRRYDGEQMIDMFNRLDGDPAAFDSRLLVTFGNHEFDGRTPEYARLLSRRIAESGFRWLNSSVRFAVGEDGWPLVAGDNLVPHQLLELGGVRVGLFSITLDKKRRSYIAGYDTPLETARRESGWLRRQGAEVVIALTHQLLADDAALLEQLGEAGPDLIIGGHEHVHHHLEVDGRWVLKADADAYSVNLVKVAVDDRGKISVQPESLVLDDRVQPDAQLLARADAWLQRYAAGEPGCEGKGRACLDAPIGYARAALVADELSIRRVETNFGNWVADVALEAHRGKGAQVALINSGSLRLNTNVPADSGINRWQLETLFPYPTPLVMLKVSGETLGQALRHAVSDWSGNGHWLQVSGIAFRFDPDSGEVSDLTLLEGDDSHPVLPEEEITLVTYWYLVDPTGNQDGYRMFNPSQQWLPFARRLHLKALVSEALQEAGRNGIAPEVEGRICINTIPGPCRALSAGSSP